MTTVQWSSSATTQFVQCLLSFDSVCFCGLDVFPAALLLTVRLL